MRIARWLLGFVLCTILAAPCGAGEFTLRSRSLMQGPAETGIFIPGGFALAAGGGIAFIDTASAAGPVWLPLEGMPKDLALAGGVLWVAAGRAGLNAIDIADLSRPRVIGGGKAWRASHCVPAGGYLHVLLETGSILTFRMNEPANPVRIGELRAKPLIDLAALGDLLLAASAGKVEIMRVLENGSLSRAGEIHTGGHIRRLVPAGNMLHIVLREGGVERWRVLDPAAPEQLEPLDVEGALDLSFAGARGIVVTKREEYLPVETSSPRTGAALKLDGFPSEGGFFARLAGRRSFPCRKIVVADGAFTAIAGKKGAALFRLEGSSHARFAEFVSTRGFAIDLVADGSSLYVSNGGDGVRIGEVSETGAVEWIGHLQTTVARDLAVEGDLLVLCDGSDGLRTIDVSDPRAPRELGHIGSPWFLSAIVLDGGRAYVGGGLGGAEIFDVSDPGNPRRVWKREHSEVRGVHVENGLWFVADGTEGMRIYRPGTKEPEHISRIDTPGWVDDVFVVGDTAYLADGGLGIKTVDVSDPAEPRLLGSVGLGGLVRNIHVRGTTLFAACHTGGIVAVDVSDPAHPVEVARRRTVDDARGVWADDRFVYLSSASGGVYVFSYDE